MSRESVNSSPQTGVDWLRPVRYLWRLPLLLLHFFINLPITLFCVAIGEHRRLASGETLRHRAIRAWSGGLCRIFGIRVRAIGTLAKDPVMAVANHMSWIDIEVLHSLHAYGFVAKAEIRSWPVLGWVAAAGGTVFHQRGCHDSQKRVTEAIEEKLAADLSVAIFPEGRTGTGEEVMPFHGRLLAAAVETGCPVQPIALEFVRDGRRNLAIPFGADENFVTNLFRVMGEAATEAQVHFLDPIDPRGMGRSEVAKEARGRIVKVLEP